MTNTDRHGHDPGGAYDVRAYGARGDGSTLCTAGLQAAIDAAAAAGGGEVLVPPGRYLTGTLYLKSHVHLHLQAGAVLLGSTHIGDYADDTGFNMYRDEEWMDRCLIFARDAEDISLTGAGTIDGQGSQENFPVGGIGFDRPMLMRFINCRRLRLRDLTLRNGAAWCAAIIWSQDICADGLTIHNAVNHNGDGLDFDGCANVRVANCLFNTSDDAICLQTSRADRPCHNVTITNCILTSKWAAFRFGLLSCGAIRDVTVSNCAIYDITGSGIKIQMCEGAVMENLLFDNIVMRNVARPIFVTLNSYRFSRLAAEPLGPTGTLRHLRFQNVRVSAGPESNMARKSFIALVGTPGNPIQNVTLNNVHFTAPGGVATRLDAEAAVPELEGKRPEHSEFGDLLPTYGLYARHVEGLTLNQVRLDCVGDDTRPAVVCDDVADLNVDGLRVQAGPGDHAPIVLCDVREGRLTNCRPLHPTDVLFQVVGAGTRAVRLAAAPGAPVRQLLRLVPPVDAGEIMVTPCDPEQDASPTAGPQDRIPGPGGTHPTVQFLRSRHVPGQSMRD